MKISTFIRGLWTGMLAGLAGTVSMYLFGASIFVHLGWATNTSFLIIGNSAAAFFSNLGISLAGGAPTGMRVYYLIGITLGAFVGIAVTCLRSLHMASNWKRIAFSVLFVEIVSLPLLAAGILALEMSAAEAVQWIGISLVMHLVYGLVLGAVTSRGVEGGFCWENR